MGLALLDVADVIRPHPEVVAFLRARRGRAASSTRCRASPGGREARDAIRRFLDEYGMRCVGEIDITRPRWSERPVTLVPADPRQRRSFEPGERAAALRAGAAGGAGEGAGGARAPAGAARRRAEGRRDQADDRPPAHLRRVPRVPEVRHGLPLLRLQAGPAAGGRAASCRRGVLADDGGHLLPPLRRAPRRRPHERGGPRAHPRAQGRVRVVPGADAAAGDHVRRGGRSPGRTGATTCRPARSSACRSPRGSSRGGPA